MIAGYDSVALDVMTDVVERASVVLLCFTTTTYNHQRLPCYPTGNLSYVFKIGIDINTYTCSGLSTARGPWLCKIP